jgi:type IV pilus assembly protein PilY1
VTQAQADTNYNALISSINALGAVANTPLAETYYEITRYMRGMAPYYNSTPTTYTSPIQYRCQKNYGVVITDGLPTYDRTFPSNDPLGGSRLPNWDGINNDGNNPNGDNEGDTLYLDDIAKFAFDIDMRSTGTDAAGKSWNAVDFPKQNMNTYTVGFTADNDMLSDAASYGQGRYYQATDSTGLNTALSSALSDITSKAGSGGAGVTSGTTLASGTSYFQTSYDPKDWRGTIKSFGFTSAGAVNTSAALDHRYHHCPGRDRTDLSIVEHQQQRRRDAGLRQLFRVPTDGAQPEPAHRHQRQRSGGVEQGHQQDRAQGAQRIARRHHQLATGAGFAQ